MTKNTYEKLMSIMVDSGLHHVHPSRRFIVLPVFMEWDILGDPSLAVLIERDETDDLIFKGCRISFDPNMTDGHKAFLDAESRNEYLNRFNVRDEERLSPCSLVPRIETAFPFLERVECRAVPGLMEADPDDFNYLAIKDGDRILLRVSGLTIKEGYNYQESVLGMLEDKLTQDGRPT